MGLIANLKLLWTNREKIKTASHEVDSIKEAYVKSGFKSTEFYLTLLSVATTLSETFKGNIDPKWGAIISASLTLGYAVVRGLTKAAASASTSQTSTVVTTSAPSDSPVTVVETTKQ